jgi:hypothetical protein
MTFLLPSESEARPSFWLPLPASDEGTLPLVTAFLSGVVLLHRRPSRYESRLGTMLRPHEHLPQLHFFASAGAGARLVGGDVAKLAKVRKVVKSPVLDEVYLDRLHGAVGAQPPCGPGNGSLRGGRTPSRYPETIGGSRSFGNGRGRRFWCRCCPHLGRILECLRGGDGAWGGTKDKPCR